jgi:hypothetical protein
LGKTPCGWVEAKRGSGWSAELNLGAFIERDDATSLLFGEGSGGSEPIAADRWFPPDLSPVVAAEIQAREVRQVPLMSASWISWTEIAALDPQTSIEGTLGVPYVYVREGEVLREVGSLPYEEYERYFPVQVDARGFSYQEWSLGQHWVEPTREIRVEEMKVHTIFEYNGWPLVLEVMRFLAQRCTPEGVRIVFWCEP